MAKNTSHRHGYGRQQREFAGSADDCDFCQDETRRIDEARKAMGIKPITTFADGTPIKVDADGLITQEF